MQLMCDAIAVLGGRHGLLLDPIGGPCRMIRFDAFTEAADFELRAGAMIDGKEYVFPLCRAGERFAFFDQRMTPCTSRFIAIDPASGMKVSLSFVTPFRPRDEQFSLVPVVGIRMTAEKIAGQFRWTPVTRPPQQVRLFFEIGPGKLHVAPQGDDALDVHFASHSVQRSDPSYEQHRYPQHDRIICTAGKREDNRFVCDLDGRNWSANQLDLSWCAHSEPVLQIQGSKHPFKYTRQFKDLDSVCAWARRNPTALFDNAARIDAELLAGDPSNSISNLKSYTLHAWLMNTWWADRDGRDWLSVWEGNCYFHSTVDVEYTQAPFYLTLWPELLGIELDYWPEYSKNGSKLLGATGEDTLFLSHDCGTMATADRQAYHHEMEVEETCNYLILLYAHWRKTGDFSIARSKHDIVRKYLSFLTAADTSGNGIPDQGVANTIDDASPAIQFGKEQVYLAVKTLAAFVCGAAVLRELGDSAAADKAEARAKLIREVIEKKGWKGDHYAVLLDASARGVIDPWTGKPLETEQIPGWDACHIYTQNGMAVLDMVGLDLGLNRRRLAKDLRTATARCLREYGCAHSDYASSQAAGHAAEGMVGSSINPGWISMNMLRDIAAAYRGIDLSHLAERYWQWQVTANTQAPAMFFETFSGNNLHFYPRGVAIWGLPAAFSHRAGDQRGHPDAATKSLEISP